MKPGKYTAKQITDLAGFEKVEFGKDRVRIAGLRGIVTAEHKINIQPGSKEITVMVGREPKKLKVE